MLAMAATVGTALGFQHLGGYVPCKLCLEQRLPYYVGIPLMALAWLAAVSRAPTWIPRALLGLGGLLMLYGFYLGAYHAGVEWGWWPGPTDCSGAPATPGAMGDFLSQLQTTHVVSCTEAAWRFLGLSLAGWNALISLALAAVAFASLLGRPEPREATIAHHGSSSVSQ
jgi:disulfide bond formation protein DsbB